MNSMKALIIFCYHYIKYRFLSVSIQAFPAISDRTKWQNMIVEWNQKDTATKCMCSRAMKLGYTKTFCPMDPLRGRYSAHTMLLSCGWLRAILKLTSSESLYLGYLLMSFSTNMRWPSPFTWIPASHVLLGGHCSHLVNFWSSREIAFHALRKIRTAEHQVSDSGSFEKKSHQRLGHQFIHLTIALTIRLRSQLPSKTLVVFIQASFPLTRFSSLFAS